MISITSGIIAFEPSLVVVGVIVGIVISIAVRATVSVAVAKSFQFVL